MSSFFTKMFPSFHLTKCNRHLVYYGHITTILGIFSYNHFEKTQSMNSSSIRLVYGAMKLAERANEIVGEYANQCVLLAKNYIFLLSICGPRCKRLRVGGKYSWGLFLNLVTYFCFVNFSPMWKFLTIPILTIFIEFY